MNYLSHYIYLIRNAKNRQYPIDISEKHHIIPLSIYKKRKNRKHLKNKSWNKVKLTPKEHFIAHLLLWKFCKKKYGEKHSYTKKMLKAIRFISLRSGQKTSRLYHKIKTGYSRDFSGPNNHMFGKKWSIVQREKLSARRKEKSGENNGNIISRKKYKITFKDGHIEIILGIRKFCKERGYCRSSIWFVLNGRQKIHKDIIKVEYI